MAKDQDAQIKELEEQIKIINEKLKDKDLEIKVRIAYENFMHQHGHRKCDGYWDVKQGKCLPSKPNIPPKVNAGQDQTVLTDSNVQFVGSIIDFENNIIKTTWTQLS